MKIFKILIVIGLFPLLFSCQQNTEDIVDGRISVVATTGMIRDVVQQVVGDKAVVEGLMGPGVDPHLYKPTPSDISSLRKADVIFYNGLHLESKMTDVLAKIGRQKPSYAVGSAIPESSLNYPNEAALPDPHIWFDLELWKSAVKLIGEKMGKFDTENASYYKDNAEQYSLKLEEIHHWTKEQIASIPLESRVLITAHDAFEYFGKAYNIEVRGLQGISTTAEFGVRDKTEMIEFIVKRKIKAVFVETAISDRSLKSVVEGCRERGHDIQIGGTLYSDALGAGGTSEGNFIGVMRFNVNTIVEALK